MLGRRLDDAGWRYRVLASPMRLETLAAMRLSAVVADPAALGPQAWTYLERLCARLPHLGLIIRTRHSSVAQRVRGLRLGADDWVTKPCHTEELMGRGHQVAMRPWASSTSLAGDTLSVPPRRPSFMAVQSSGRGAPPMNGGLAMARH